MKNESNHRPWLLHLSEQRLSSVDSQKDLDKLIKKISSLWSAPVSDKDVKRTQPFAQNEELMALVNQELTHYFMGTGGLKGDDTHLRTYDAIAFWNLFTLLVHCDKVQSAVPLVLNGMLGSRHADLRVMRRVFHLCNSGVYGEQFAQVEAYFQDMRTETTIYRWLNSLNVTAPSVYDWELIFRLRARSDTGSTSLLVRGFEPDGRGRSFEIQIGDSDNNESNRWDDFSNEMCFFRQQEFTLKRAPNILELKEFIAEIEETLLVKFERGFDFSFFTKGFKKKENIQKWLRGS